MGKESIRHMNSLRLCHLLQLALEVKLPYPRILWEEKPPLSNLLNEAGLWEMVDEQMQEGLACSGSTNPRQMSPGYIRKVAKHGTPPWFLLQDPVCVPVLTPLSDRV